MFVFQVVCLVTGTNFFAVPLFDMLSLSINYFGVTAFFRCSVAYYFTCDFDFFFHFLTSLESSVLFSYFSWLNVLLLYLFKFCTRQPDKCDFFF